MSNGDISVGVIGFGVGEAHAEALSRNPKCRLVGVCDIDEEKICRARSKYEDVLITKNAAEILDHDEIDLVVVASYDDCHYEQIMRAVKNNKHVFVEKPLCLYEEDARGIRNALRAKPGIRLSSNLILRKYPRFIQLKDMIANGDMGKLFYVEGDYNYGRLNKITDGWRGKIDFYSVVYGGGVHIIDLLIWLTGASIIEVAAFGNNICSNGSEFKYNDMVVSAMKFDNGIVGKISANFGCVYPHFHKLALYGTEATFENNLKEGIIYNSRNPEDIPRLIQGEYPGVGKGNLLSDFINAIHEGRAPEISEDDVFKTMSVCFAIEKSAKVGKSLPVAYI